MVAAGALIFGWAFPTSGEFFFYFGIIMMLKAGFNFYRFRHLNPVPWLDVLAGICLLLVFFSIKSSLFLLIGLLLLVKGLFAFLSTAELG